MAVSPEVLSKEGTEVPLVSILCLTYNHENYINNALRGFIQQKTSFPFEIIIHDDNSSDNTKDILKHFFKNDEHDITLILEKENQFKKHVSILQQLMLPRAKGKYIAICEGDDFWTDSYKLQLQFDALESHLSANCCVCDVEEYDDLKQRTTGKLFEVKSIESSSLISRDEVIPLILGSYPFQTSGYFIRKSALLRPQSEDEKKLFSVWLDRAILLSCAVHGDFFYIKKPMSCYRVNVNTSISAKWAKQVSYFIKSRQIHIYVYKLFDSVTNYKYHYYVKQILDRWQNELDKSVISVLAEKGQYSKIWKEYRKSDVFARNVPLRIRIASLLHIPSLFKRIYNFLKQIKHYFKGDMSV